MREGLVHEYKKYLRECGEFRFRARLSAVEAG
jgi:hypothetical protein